MLIFTLSILALYKNMQAQVQTSMPSIKLAFWAKGYRICSLLKRFVFKKVYDNAASSKAPNITFKVSSLPPSIQLFNLTSHQECKFKTWLTWMYFESTQDEGYLRMVPTNSQVFLRDLPNIREKKIITCVIEIQKENWG